MKCLPLCTAGWLVLGKGKSPDAFNNKLQLNWTDTYCCGQLGLFNSGQQNGTSSLHLTLSTQLPAHGDGAEADDDTAASV